MTNINQTDAVATVADIFALQKTAYAKNPYPDQRLRRDRLDRMLDMLVTEKNAICDAVAADFGFRSPENTQMFDIVPALHALKYAKKHLASWMKPARRRSSFPYNWLGGKSYVKPVPLGVVANISPWNFPVLLAISPMAAILAAGNRAMLKPSEFTPATAALLESLIAARFDADEVAVLNGGAEVAQAFTRLNFDHLLFTGSTAVAKMVAQSTAPNLVPTTLELGGKSPVVVSKTANLADLAKKLLYTKTLNAGQICLAPDYVLVPRESLQPLIALLRDEAKKMFPAGVDSPDYVNVIHARHIQRFQGYLDESRQLGNSVIDLFDAVESGDQRRLAPKLVVMNNTQGAIMRDEIFGPLLPLVAVDSWDEVMAAIAERSRPLALYYFGRDQREIAQLEQDVCCGGMVVNDLLLHFLQDDLPFGGVGDSGMGYYHGREGFEQFSHKKSVFVAPRWDVGALARPPYGAAVKRLLTMELRK